MTAHDARGDVVRPQESRSPGSHQPPLQPPPEVLRDLGGRVGSAAHVVMLLDYDGTLVPFAPAPGLAEADAAILALLADLGRHPRFEVHVVSGRSRETLERWLGSLQISLHAEHGAWSRLQGASDWTPHHVPAMAWRQPALAIFEDFAARTPGVIVEEKSFGIAWHYRMADPDYGASQANELTLHLSTLLANEPVEFVLGEKVIELRPHGIHKGRVVASIVERAHPGWLFMAIGDDRTDEDLFAALPPNAIAIHVGQGATAAAVRLADVTAVRAFLRALLENGASPPA